MKSGEAFGRALGGILAPLAFEGSLVRGARLFHPDGVVHRAEVRPIGSSGALGNRARRLEGPALVRLSAALFREGGWELPDVLGVAVRFTGERELSATPSAGDQDLLFASFRSIPGLLVAPFTTRVGDYLANEYHAVLPFDTAGLGRTWYRLVPEPLQTSGRDRNERLERAVAAGLAILRLEVRREGEAFQPVAEIQLREEIEIDQSTLAFSPQRAGRGIVPAGFWQAVRSAVYPASQLGRHLARVER